jgi:cytochrome P450
LELFDGFSVIREVWRLLVCKREMMRMITIYDDIVFQSIIKSSSMFSLFGSFLIGSIIISFLLIYIKRQHTKYVLENYVGLPTVYWRPKFFNYKPFEEDPTKLASSTITKILPRMSKLNGPYGMYGTVYGISTPVIHIAHPIPAKAILNNNNTTSTKQHQDGLPTSHQQHHRRRNSITNVINSSGASKAPAYNHFKNFCGDGVFTADGDDWKAKRSAVMHTLIKGSTRSDTTHNLLQDEANHAANAFCQQVESLRQQRMQSITTNEKTRDDDIAVPNIVPMLQRATVGLIYRYITHDDPEWAILPRDRTDVDDNFKDNNKNDDSVDDVESISLASSEEEGDHIIRTTTPTKGEDETKEGGMASASSSSTTTTTTTTGSSEGTLLLEEYLKSIVRIRMIILAQSRSVWFVLPRWCYRWFSSLYRDEEQTLGPIREFAKAACTNAKPQSPLHKLTTISDGPYYTPTTTIGNKESVINKNLLDEAITLLFAGQDTSAATLSWTLHLLSLYPNVQDRLAKEVQKAFQEEDEMKANSHGSIVVTKKMISKMPYLDAVIKESMRLYPVAPFIVRRLIDDVTISKDKESSIILPSGSVACVWIYGLHRNPSFWDRPDDFIPERWIDGDLKDPGQSNGAYMPFASGPRNCVGQPLAHIILRTLLSKLVYQYEFIDSKLADCDGVHVDVNDLRKDMQAGFTVLPTGGVELTIRKRSFKEKYS